MIKLLIATQNKGKRKEFQALLSDLNFELVTPADLNLDLQVSEDGQSYQENAIKKSKAYADATGLLTCADDTGLEVDALGGKPGLFSARYTNKPQATDADRRSHLLQELELHPKPWSAQFICLVAVHDPRGKTHLAEGVCKGHIISQERGEQGFGYDSIFQVSGTDFTMAELSLEVKNKISHRARAVHNIRPVLIDLMDRSSISFSQE